MPPRINYKSNSGSSRWITISLAALLLASAAFMGWSVYVTRFNKETARKIAGITGPTATPPPPRFNCPLDGTIVPDRASASRRPVLVQVDNAPGARPQSGLSQADIVYEAMAEGDVTRFSAIFACHEAETVGPVRSARLINLELVPEYDALLANSGSSDGVTEEIEASPGISNITHSNYPDAYWRTGDRYAPHNLMTSTEGIRSAAASAGLPATASLSSLAFKDDTPAPALSTIGVRYSAAVDVSYQYDPGTNSWLRFLQSNPHIDTLNGKQLAPKNVIIQYVNISQSSIEEDVGGNRGLIFELTGTGKVQVFRDGQAINGTWKRDSASGITRYLDTAGQPVPLNRGLTFIQLVPLDFQPVTG